MQSMKFNATQVDVIKRSNGLFNHYKQLWCLKKFYISTDRLLTIADWHAYKLLNQHVFTQDIVSEEPEGYQFNDVLLRTIRVLLQCKVYGIAPFWFSTEHHWTALMPFWLLGDDILHVYVKFRKL